jgi:hypothetical protein
MINIGAQLAVLSLITGLTGLTTAQAQESSSWAERKEISA